MSSDAAVPEAVIEAVGLGKRYRMYAQPSDRLWQGVLGRFKTFYTEFTALEGVSFEVGQGETVGIVGRNGSGKSTLLQLVCGTLTPTSGRVQVRGRVAALLELGAGFNPEFSGLENVFLNAAMFGMPRHEMERRLSQVLAFADIGEHVHHPVKTYSSGMFVRLAFAVVAHVDADVLIVDEALAVGDAFFTQKCMRFLRQFKERGGTLLFVSHDAGSVTNLCERALWLDRGQLRAQGPAKDVVNQYLASRYAGDVGSEDLPAAKAEPSAQISATRPNGADVFARESQAADLAALAGASFGVGGGHIFSVQLRDLGGTPITSIAGGEPVSICIQAVFDSFVAQPVAGFYVKDRLGQMVFGDNSAPAAFVADPIEPTGRQRFEASFTLTMPHLVAGEYVLTAAVGRGDQEQHEIIHWVHEAMAFRSTCRVMHGLVAVPSTVQCTSEASP